MKKSLVLAMAMALGVTASAYAANPFSDVPAGHWAYDSVAKLATAGVVDGYVDGAFGGDKLMTRYEMAQIVAKAMAKGANVDKLAAEFADELDTLGVRVAKLEKGADAVKITGEVRYRYWDKDGKTTGTEDALRTRIWIAGQVNEDWTYTGMLQNQQKLTHDDKGEEGTDFQRAYLDGKLGGLKVRAGRYNYTDAFGGMIYDDRVDGATLTYGKDVQLTLLAAEATDQKTADKAINADTMYMAQLGTKLGVVDAKVAYFKFEDVKGGLAGVNGVGSGNPAAKYGPDYEMYVLGATMPLAKDVKLMATYVMNESDVDNDDDGYIVGLNYKGAKASKPGSWGLWAKYYDMASGTFVAGSSNVIHENLKDGYEGYGIGASYALAKNIVANVEWYDLDAQTGSDDQETLYAQVNFSF